MAHELSPEKYNELLSKALMMPQFIRKNNLGQPLVKTVIKFIKGKNLTTELREQIKGKIHEHDKYKVEFKEPVCVDHKENIIKIFRKEGQKGVDAYIEFFAAEFEAAKKEAAKKEAAELDAAKKEKEANASPLKIVK